MSEHTLSSSYEDYIEAIYDLHEKSGGEVRSVDVANELNFTKASVARALKKLREWGYVDQQRYGEIRLTKKGLEYGKSVLWRHRVLRGFLIDVLGVDKTTANDEACEIEHTISEDTMQKWADWYERQDTKQTGFNEGLIAKGGRKEQKANAETTKG